MKEYTPLMDVFTTQQAIAVLRRSFEKKLGQALNLTRVSAPLFVEKNSGINDDLNGVERPVEFDILQTGAEVEVVHSLAKWKRMALSRYGFKMHTGLYTNMNAIRRDETCDNVHSLYVDQWDWEKVISADDRTQEYLKETVRKIYSVVLSCADELEEKYPVLKNDLAREISFVTSQQLEDEYPNLTAKQREDEAAKKYGAVFIIGIGGKLKSGKKHDGRAPDYDDWSLNGDILVYDGVLERALEISSMGIRVDKESLLYQLREENAESRLNLPFHKALAEGKLPLSIGGGIGQSRLCMLLLKKWHIAEVHCSVWPDSEVERCKEVGAVML